jgi:hypothetical protein
MNKIINYYKNNGDVVENISRNICKNLLDPMNYDYAQISLINNLNNMMLVSRSDVMSVIRCKWYLGSSGYPITYGSYDKTIQFSKPVSLHRLLFGKLEKGFVVDHINRNKLDNRRDNLRICTIQENSFNKTKSTNGTNKYKGVIKNGTSYSAVITRDGIKREIKNISTEEEAAKIYDIMAEELFGHYAAKNFI